MLKFKNAKGNKKTTIAGIAGVVVLGAGLFFGWDENTQNVVTENIEAIIAGITSLILVFGAKD